MFCVLRIYQLHGDERLLSTFLDSLLGKQSIPSARLGDENVPKVPKAVLNYKGDEVTTPNRTLHC
jgi:hypothetical protein